VVYNIFKCLPNLLAIYCKCLKKYFFRCAPSPEVDITDISSRTCLHQIFRRGQRKIRDCVKRFSRECIKIPFEPVMEQEKKRKPSFLLECPHLAKKGKLLPATQKRVSEGKRASHFIFVCCMPRILGDVMLFQRQQVSMAFLNLFLFHATNI
jgi:hypothetical protein